MLKLPSNIWSFVEQIIPGYFTRREIITPRNNNTRMSARSAILGREPKITISNLAPSNNEILTVSARDAMIGKEPKITVSNLTNEVVDDLTEQFLKNRPVDAIDATDINLTDIIRSNMDKHILITLHYLKTDDKGEPKDIRNKTYYFDVPNTFNKCTQLLTDM